MPELTLKNWRVWSGIRRTGTIREGPGILVNFKDITGEKKELDETLTQIGADNPAAGPIIKAKTAIDEAIKIVEAEIEAAAKKKNKLFVKCAKTSGGPQGSPFYFFFGFSPVSPGFSGGSAGGTGGWSVGGIHPPTGTGRTKRSRVNGKAITFRHHLIDLVYLSHRLMGLSR